MGGIDDSASFKRWESLFRVEYIPIPPSIRYEVVRDDVQEVNIHSYGTINQKLRIVDLNAFTNNIKGRVNQLSESELTLSHKVKNIENSFNIGDFTEDKFVITKKEVIVQRDHYIINYELNRNFNKISQFVGIDQEIRQWEIGERGRSLDRDLNYNEFIEIYADDLGSGNKGNTTIQNPELFLRTFADDFPVAELNLGIFESDDVKDDNGVKLKLNIPFYKMSGGGAFGLYYDFETNASAGDSLVTGDGTFLGFGSNRRFNVPVRYANDIGRFENMKVSFSTGGVFVQGTNEQEFDFGNSLPEVKKTIQNKINVIEGEFLVEKDNRERIKMSLLYHIISRNIDEVVIGNKLLTHNSFFINKPNNLQLRLFKNRLFTIRDKNIRLTNEEQRLTSGFLSINNSDMSIQISSNVDLTDIDAWAITDEEGFPFVIVNKIETLKRKLNFVFRNKHPRINYILQGLQTNKQEVILETNTFASSIINLFGFPSQNLLSNAIVSSQLSLQGFDSEKLSTNTIASSTLTFDFFEGLSLTSSTQSSAKINLNI